MQRQRGLRGRRDKPYDFCGASDWERASREIMPTVLRGGPYRLFFYSGDGSEPPHVHVERDDRICKFWLDPVRMQGSGGLARAEIRRIARIVQQHQATLIEAWNEYFDY